MRHYEIVGEAGCWKLTMYQGGEELAGGVFPPTDGGYQDALEIGEDWVDKL